jgi:hypothetical protein
MNNNGPFYVQQHPITDDICVYDASNCIVECFFWPQQAHSYCDELNEEHKHNTKQQNKTYIERKTQNDNS